LKTKLGVAEKMRANMVNPTGTSFRNQAGEAELPNTGPLSRRGIDVTFVSELGGKVSWGNYLKKFRGSLDMRGVMDVKF